MKNIIALSLVDIKVGDIVISTANITYQYMKILVGAEFEVVSIDKSYNLYYLKLGDIIVNVHGTDDITKKVTLNKAKQEYDYRLLYDYSYGVLEKNCPYLKIDYDHRDEYNACGLIDSVCCNYCNPTDNCFQYLHGNIKKDKKIIDYIRQLKLNRILKKQ